MAFYDLVDKVVELLQRRGRLSYRALKLEFDLTDARIDDLKYELVEVQRVARDENGLLLVWTPTPTTPPDDHHVASPPAVIAPPLAPDRPGRPAGADAERRQLTVLFCDLVGSTALSTELDPEELREVLDEYQTVCARVIEHFGGVIARQVGDGLLVNFGYPQAYEDDAGRGVRAGLAIIGALPELNARLAPRFVHLRQRRLRLRIGLHTGLVVVGALGASTYRDPMAVVGETPNIAARLQGLAEPDEVVVSGTTRRLLGDAFECDDLGLHELKGVTAPVPVYRVLRERDAPDRAASGGRRTPLVGREQEVGVLLDRWEQSKEGHGQIVLLSGDAGIGKSRLVQELKAHVAGERHVRIEGRGSPYHQQSAFHPIVDLVEHPLRFERGDSSEAKLEKLTIALRDNGLPVDTMLPVFARLLGLAAPAIQDMVLSLTPQRPHAAQEHPAALPRAGRPGARGEVPGHGGGPARDPGPPLSDRPRAGRRVPGAGLAWPEPATPTTGAHGPGQRALPPRRFRRGPAALRAGRGPRGRPGASVTPRSRGGRSAGDLSEPTSARFCGCSGIPIRRCSASRRRLPSPRSSGRPTRGPSPPR